MTTDPSPLPDDDTDEHDCFDALLRKRKAVPEGADGVLAVVSHDPDHDPDKHGALIILTRKGMSALLPLFGAFTLTPNDDGSVTLRFVPKEVLGV